MKKELITRTITGLALVVIIGLAIIKGGLLFWFTCLMLSTLFYKEYVNIYKNKKSYAFFFSTGILGIIYYLGIYFQVYYILQICLLLILIYGAFRVITKFPLYTYKNIKTTIMGFLYCYVFLSSLYLLRMETNGFYWILFILSVSVFGDVGAYLVGKVIGKRKIAPVLSPGKTLEGLIGGMIFAVVIGAFLGTLTLKFYILLAVILSIAIVIIGLMGDLFESHLKREVNIKDTGSILPGHGGFLDRFDAIIFISGFVYLLLSIFYRGVN